MPSSSVLQEISAAGAGGRGAQGGASGCKGLREEGGRSAGEGGRNWDGKGRLCGKAETGRRTTDTRRSRTAAQARGRRGQEHEQVSIDGDRGEYRTRGNGQEGSNAASEVWSGAYKEESKGSAKEEKTSTSGGAEW